MLWIFGDDVNNLWCSEEGSSVVDDDSPSLVDDRVLETFRDLVRNVRTSHNLIDFEIWWHYGYFDG